MLWGRRELRDHGGMGMERNEGTWGRRPERDIVKDGFYQVCAIGTCTYGIENSKVEIQFFFKKNVLASLIYNIDICVCFCDCDSQIM